MQDSHEASRQSRRSAPYDQAAKFMREAAAISRQACKTGELRDFEIATDLFRQALSLIPDDHVHHSFYLFNLGVHLGFKFQHASGSLGDLDESIDLRRTVQKPGIKNSDLIDFRDALGSRLGDRYTLLGDPSDLDMSIDISRAVLKATPKANSAYCERLSTLGNRLGDKYLKDQSTGTLQEAIEISRQAATVATTSHHEREASILSNLGVLIGYQYDRSGDIEDLEEGIEVFRQCPSSDGDEPLSQALVLNGLGNLLGERFVRTGAKADSDEAIDKLRKSAALTPEHHFRNHAIRLNNLGTALGNRFWRERRLPDLKDAIEKLQKALEMTPYNYPIRPTLLSNLSVQLCNQYLVDTDTREQLESLHGSIKAASEAVQLSRTAPRQLPRLLSNLASLLAYKYSHSRGLSDINDAIQNFREASEGLPVDHHDLAELSSNLGMALHDKYQQTNVESDLREAADCFQRALENDQASISFRIRAGRRFLSLKNVLHDKERAYDVAKTTVGLIPLSAPYSLQNDDKQHQLSQAFGLASDAAAIALEAGKGWLSAINLIETGRCVLAGSLQGLRTDISALKQENPELADAFLQLRDELDISTPQTTAKLAPDSADKLSKYEADRRHKASSEMTQLLTRIRGTPGFERFLLPLTESEMHQAAENGPIVIINVSPHRCDALIIEQAPPIRGLRLPCLYSELREYNKDLRSPKTLVWLWEKIVEPILVCLKFTAHHSGDPWPHIWWIPTGLLTNFPLHAAGDHVRRKRESAIDFVISSYGSSVKALSHLRHAPLKMATERKYDIVLIDMPETPDCSLLRHATSEIETVRSICESMTLTHVTPKAYLQDASPALESCRILHFAGHGKSSSLDPLDSKLLLKDWKTHPLTVAHILERNLTSHAPFLAYLSACGTGQVLDDKSTDENMHLANAFQLAGFRHVIGTLWEVDDALCVRMSRLFYEYLRDNMTAGNTFSDEVVSGGLHHATRQLRNERFPPLETRAEADVDSMVLRVENLEKKQMANMLWVPYVHYGA